MPRTKTSAPRANDVQLMRVRIDQGAMKIFAERERQVIEKGFTPTHDDEHTGGELVSAAMAYLDVVHYSNEYGPLKTSEYRDKHVPYEWPFAKKRWNPSDPIRDLIRAGALIAAEIDRLLRVKVKRGKA